MRVLFWGTPDFALPTLRALAAGGHTVVGVVTRPDRPRGRGRKQGPSPVRSFAEARGYRVLTPERPRGEEFVDAILGLRTDISVVVAYGCILPRQVLDAPPLGSVNVHASLLPAFRGAAPVNWAIALGHAVTGVTVMRMVERMDAGPILAREELPIALADTAALLSRRLAELGAVALTDTLARMEAGPVEEVEQDHAAATFAPKVSRESARVDWTRSAREVADLIRGMDDVPGAWTLLRGDPVKVFHPVVAEGVAAGRPGRIVAADPGGEIAVAAGTGVVRIGEVQPPGKRRMASAAWVRGRGADVGDRFE